MSDEELAAAAYVLRKRGALGDHAALKQAQSMESALRERLGSTPSGHAPLEAAVKKMQAKPWWRFW